MFELFNSFEEITCHTDGSSINNPGISGAGVSFSGINRLIDDKDL